jgi:hypothetical protein
LGGESYDVEHGLTFSPITSLMGQRYEINPAESNKASKSRGISGAAPSLAKAELERSPRASPESAESTLEQWSKEHAYWIEKLPDS